MQGGSTSCIVTTVLSLEQRRDMVRQRANACMQLAALEDLIMLLRQSPAAAAAAADGDIIAGDSPLSEWAARGGKGGSHLVLDSAAVGAVRDAAVAACPEVTHEQPNSLTHSITYSVH